MDLTQRGSHQRSAASNSPQNTENYPANRSKRRVSLLNVISVLLLFSITVLIAALTLYIRVGGKGTNPGKYVDTTKYQAVFLNGGQVYFGKVVTLNDKFLRVKDIYYLRVNQQVQPDAKASTTNNDVSLVKLGCELHGPQDQMVINSDQVSFWENLEEKGQVVQAIHKFAEQNPNGQDCSKPAQDASSTPATDKKQ